MKCFVINLDRSENRLTHIAREFARVGAAFQRVAAVDGQTLKTFPRHPEHMSAGEVACFLSHKKCWELVADGHDEYATIFEDDVYLCARAAPMLTQDGWVPRDADIVKIETFLNKTIVGIIPTKTENGFSVSRLYGDHPGTAGYVISKRAAKRFLSETMEILCPVDGFFFGSSHQTGLAKVVYQISPALCIQSRFVASQGDLLQSEITGDNPDHTPVEKPKRTAIGKLAAEAKRTLRNLSLASRLLRATAIPFHSDAARTSPARSSPNNWLAT